MEEDLKQIIKPRPICLHEDTCLHLKEKTRLCEYCVHHKNYWSELLEKEQLEKIKSLEQECEELKEKYKWYDHYKEQALFNKNLCNKKSDKIDQLKAENEILKEKLVISSNSDKKTLKIQTNSYRDKRDCRNQTKTKCVCW